MCVCVCWLSEKNAQIPPVGVAKRTSLPAAEDSIKQAKIQRQVSLGTSPAPRTSSLHSLTAIYSPVTPLPGPRLMTSTYKNAAKALRSGSVRVVEVRCGGDSGERGGGVGVVTHPSTP